ncbi:hypothetical protein GTY75_08645 [Streptomyces sp. SID8381]|uniref:hypothetical protein n=1 Tax=unclassified Streptomyces TaxID=2593676 RepID=UPI00037A0C1A|nr:MULTISPECIES: hypothetical protein [unclassified Streptomyces]MYX26736.1 hypothetical protein [Streptomyces sp. SID8381]
MPAENGPSREEVDAEIAFLAQLSDEDFAAEFAALVQDLPARREVSRMVTGLAFRSDDLTRRTMKAAKALHRAAEKYLAPVAGESRGAHDRRLAEFRTAMEREQALLQFVMDAYPARRGRFPTRRNPRRRAADELARRHPEEYLALVRQEEEKDRAAAKKPRAPKREE